jgi:hypothetical protein
MVRGYRSSRASSNGIGREMVKKISTKVPYCSTRLPLLVTPEDLPEDPPDDPPELQLQLPDVEDPVEEDPLEEDPLEEDPVVEDPLEEEPDDEGLLDVFPMSSPMVIESLPVNVPEDDVLPVDVPLV